MPKRLEFLIHSLLAGVATVGTGIVVYGLLKNIGVDSIVFAIALNFILPLWMLAVFALAQPDCTRPWMDVYYRPKKWERNGALWRRLGVLQFHALQERSPMRRKRPAGFRVTRDRAFLQHMELETRWGETAHLICFLVILGLAIYAAVLGKPIGVFWLLLTGLIFQLYPVFLQRYNRPRWRALLARLDCVLARSSSTPSATAIVMRSPLSGDVQVVPRRAPR